MLNQALEKLKRNQERRRTSSSGKHLVRLRVRRLDEPQATPYWEEFAVPYRPAMNVLSLLEEIRRRPINSAGRAVSPVTWDSGCRMERCGSCTMVINGRARPACSARVDELHEPVCLEPLSAFPVVRDLVSDRTKEEAGRELLNLWTPTAGLDRVLPAERIDPQLEKERQALAECISCSACLEACPRYHENSPYVGAEFIAKARFYDRHPVGGLLKGERAKALAGPGGIEDCGDARNCVKACPKGIALDDFLARARRTAITGWLRGLTA